MTTLNDLSLEQQQALRTASRNLAAEFDGTFGKDTIELFLVSSYEGFAANATVHTFLPLMVERFARQRLRALAKVDGLASTGIPTVLFLCVRAQRGPLPDGPWLVQPPRR